MCLLVTFVCLWTFEEAITRFCAFIKSHQRAPSCLHCYHYVVIYGAITQVLTSYNIQQLLLFGIFTHLTYPD